MKWSWEVFFSPANPDLVDILGDMDLDLGKFCFVLLCLLGFQISGLPDSHISKIWPGLGPEPSGSKNVYFLM